MTRLHFRADIAALEFFVWLLINILFSDVGGNRSCRESLDTLHEISNCPKNENEWKSRAYLKNCASVKQNCSSERQKFQYHCVLNENGEGTVEVCAPTFFLQGYCATYRTSIAAIDNFYKAECSKFVNSCPDRFLSNESFKYQECYVIPEKQTPPLTTVKIPEKQKPPLTTVKIVEVNEKNGIKVHSSSSPDSTLTLVLTLGIGIPLIFIIGFVGLILGIILILKHKFKKGKTSEATEQADMMDGSQNAIQEEDTNTINEEKERLLSLPNTPKEQSTGRDNEGHLSLPNTPKEQNTGRDNEGHLSLPNTPEEQNTGRDNEGHLSLPNTPKEQNTGRVEYSKRKNISGDERDEFPHADEIEPETKVTNIENTSSGNLTMQD